MFEQSEPTTEKVAESFEHLVAAERLWINRRRKPHDINPEAEPAGLALSGGGIRSATFSLGLLQALSACGMLSRFDYLSTVSGGSYIGSALGALFVPAAARGGDPNKPRPALSIRTPFQSPRGEEAVRRLRDSGRYLTPAGTSDAFLGAVILARNWATLQLAIGMLALFVFWAFILAAGITVKYLPSSAVFVRIGTANVVLTTLLYVAAMPVGGAALAYWLTRRDWIPGNRIMRMVSNLLFWLLVLVAIAASTGWWRPEEYGRWLPSAGHGNAALIGVIACALVLHAVAEWRHGAVAFTKHPENTAPEAIADQRRRDLRNPQLLVPAEDRVRSFHSRVLSRVVTWMLGITALIVVDWIGQILPGRVDHLVRLMADGQWLHALKSAWPALVAAIPPLFTFLAARRLNTTGEAARVAPASRTATILLAGGLLLLAAWLMLWSALAHRLADQSNLPGQTAVLCALAVGNMVASLSFSFINLSSLSTFYASRLRRAYIGASSYGTPFTSVSEDDPEDAIRLESYYSAGLAEGAPLHLINVTIAETVPSGSNLVARDRKGKPMHLSVAGIVFEAERPGKMTVRGRRWGEELPLANWIAISGAAVSAAIGSGTTLGTSILATMVNTRLGYWWKQDSARKRPGWWTSWRDTVQNHLLTELRGAFRGTTGNRWYLTDGGHFENTGVYPLLQRELRFIVMSDNGADPDYHLEDLMRLIGRSRNDLNVKIDFLDAADLEPQLGRGSPLLGTIGPLSALVRGDPAIKGGPIAALARLTYSSGKTGLLLLIKPRLTFYEPPEVLSYQAGAGCASFPQQTTGDQFFDEQQWEAYRRLGEIAGEALFSALASSTKFWTPDQELPK